MGLAGPDPGIPAPEVARRTAVILGWIVGYLIAIWLLGFTLGGALCTFLSLKVGSRERWPVSLAMTVGMAALLLLLPLAATSTAGMIKRLGAVTWRRLHRLAYVAGLLGVLHFLWLAKVGRQDPYLYAGWLVLVLGIRLGDAVRRRILRA